MTVEQYKQMKKNQKAKRADIIRMHKKIKQKLIMEARDENNQEMLFSITNWKIENKRLKLPRNTFTWKIREAFEELVLNDVAATEGSCGNTCSMEEVDELIAEMCEVTGITPTSYCYFTRQDIPDFKKGSFYLGWEGDVDLIKSILEKNGLNVIYENERTKLLIEEK